MPKVKIKETTTVNGKTFFAGTAFVSDDDAKALEDFAAQSDENSADEAEEKQAVKKPLSRMNKAELIAEAESLGVSVTPDSDTVKQIIAAIESAQDAKPEAESTEGAKEAE